MTVSDNDIQNLSQGETPDISYEEFQEEIQEDIHILGDTLESIDYTCTAILFVIVVIWIESRLRNAVWRFMGHGKSD